MALLHYTQWLRYHFRGVAKLVGLEMGGYGMQESIRGTQMNTPKGVSVWVTVWLVNKVPEWMAV